MNALCSLAIAAVPVILAQTAQGGLEKKMIVYYDFEQAGAEGLLNKAPGASSYHLTWGAPGTLSRTGFKGDAMFKAEDGTSNRGTLLAGNALNLVDSENAFLIAPVSSAHLGEVFTVSFWTYLAYGDKNESPRFHVLESADPDAWDLSWGTTEAANESGYDDYVAWLDDTASLPVDGLAPFKWQHVLLEFDLSEENRRLSIHLNGNKVVTTINDTDGLISFTGLHIGRHRAGPGDRDWDGMIDEFAIWTRTLTRSEKSKVYKLGCNSQSLLKTR